MTPRRSVWIGMGLLTLLVAVAGGWWLQQNLVQDSREEWTGYSETVRRNPLYLAERLLIRLGRTAHSVRRLQDLPADLKTADTVLMTAPSFVLSAAETRRWLAWVAQGGHLLIRVEREHEPGQSGDHLLNALQVRSHKPEQCAPGGPSAVQPDPARPPLHVRFAGNLRLNTDGWQALAWGQGQVTLLTDLNMFANTQLDDYEHAGFLWALLQRNPDGAIWLQYQMQLPSLLQLLWERAWVALIVLLLTLLATLWHASRRLGPLLAPRADAQRRLVEHLDASSRFLWRRGAGPVLLQAARHYTLRRIQRRQGRDAEMLASALTDSDQPLNETTLLQTLRTLQRLNHPGPRS